MRPEPKTITIIQPANGHPQTDDPVPPAFRRHHAELERLTFRTKERAARWLVWLAQASVASLQEREQRDLRNRIAALAQIGVVESRLGLHSRTTTLPWNWRGAPGSATLVGELTPEQEIEQWRLPSPDTVAALQSTLRQDLERFIETGELEYQQLSGRLKLFHDKKKDRVIEFFWPDWSHDDTPENAFRYRYARVIGSVASRLRRCPSCQVLFLGRRRDQKHCGRKCQGRMAMRRRRNTPPERYGKRGRPRKRAVPSNRVAGTDSGNGAGIRKAAGIGKSGR